MIRAALACDYPGCNAIVRKESAQHDGWLTVGGGKRGHMRADLCGYHAREIVGQILASRKSVARKRP